MRNPLLKHFPIYKRKIPKLICHILGQVQPRFIFCINYKVLESSMAHTKFQSHHPFCSGKEDFHHFLTKNVHDSHLRHVTKTPWTKFPILNPDRIQVTLGFNQPSGFSEDDVWKGWRVAKFQWTSTKVKKLTRPKAK